VPPFRSCYHVRHILKRHICMDKILKFNGIPFHIKYAGDVLTTCNPLCPNCQSALVKQVAEDGRAAYVCNAQGKGCENLLESFPCAEEMAEFERAVAIEIERYLHQGAADTELTYDLTRKRAGSQLN